MDTTARDKTAPEARVVVISNLHYFAQDQDVRSFLRGFRVVDFKRGVNPKTRKPSGTGYVLMAALEDAKNAIEARDGWKILNRVVELKFARKSPKVDEDGFVENTATRRSVVDGSWQAWEAPHGSQSQDRERNIPTSTPNQDAAPELSQEAVFGLQSRKSRNRPKNKVGVKLQKIRMPMLQTPKSQRAKLGTLGIFGKPEPRARHANLGDIEAESQSNGRKHLKSMLPGNQIRIADLFKQPSTREDCRTVRRESQDCLSDADDDEQGRMLKIGRKEYKAGVSNISCEEEDVHRRPYSHGDIDGRIAQLEQRTIISDTRVPGQWSLAITRNGNELPKDFVSEAQWYSFWQTQKTPESRLAELEDQKDMRALE